MKQKLPEKIYIGTRKSEFPGDVISTVDKDWPNAKEYINNTPALSYLSFYYNHFELDDDQKNPPLIVSCKEMENFIIATCNESNCWVC